MKGEQTTVELRERAIERLRDQGHGGTFHAIEIDAGAAVANEVAASIIRDLLTGFARTSSSDFMADEIDAANEWLRACPACSGPEET